MPDDLPPVVAPDLLDRQIATMLAQDARLSFRKIAADLGVTEGTVRGRVKRLQTGGLLKLTPIVDMSRAGLADGGGQIMVFVTVTCASGRLDEVRDRLLDLPLVRALYDANAAHRLVAVCLLATVAEAAEVTNQILALDGIREAESEIVLQTVKYNAAIGPIATLEDFAPAATETARRSTAASSE
ncbi:Lrp/AsnC family transcriptional regulator [Novosphingobium sp.]|uniref:Lrp/AsnC family transcriptional regulator n=1 Tax=Novosphingobium sp. TaxID=1874826 RepID=UPI002613F025|nr:Lrp/AsnC family transcriptional regulator [Novosphingobium sp.]